MPVQQERKVNLRILPQPNKKGPKVMSFFHLLQGDCSKALPWPGLPSYMPVHPCPLLRNNPLAQTIPCPNATLPLYPWARPRTGRWSHGVALLFWLLKAGGRIRPRVLIPMFRLPRTLAHTTLFPSPCTPPPCSTPTYAWVCRKTEVKNLFLSVLY